METKIKFGTKEEVIEQLVDAKFTEEAAKEIVEDMKDRGETFKKETSQNEEIINKLRDEYPGHITEENEDEVEVWIDEQLEDSKETSDKELGEGLLKGGNQ